MINPDNNKLLSIIESFSKVELNRLSKFINSPYFNSNNDITNLYLGITNKFGEHLEFTKMELWLAIHPNNEFNSLKFRKVFSDLLKLLEQFLSQEVYNGNKILKANYLLKAIGKRELKKLYSTSLTNAYRASEKTRFKESKYYYYQYQREKNVYELNKSDLDRSSESNLNDIINNLDYFYLAEKMRYLCEILIREDVISMEYDILFRDEIVNHIAKYGYEEIPSVSIYYQMYLTLKENDDSNYHKLKALLEKNIDIFPLSEAREIYTSVINYCIKKINQGDDSFLNEFLLLNETLLEKNIIADNELSPWRFKNIVTVGLKSKRFEWVENFIEIYKEKVPLKYRENAITFNTAQLYFYQKKYEDLLALVLQVEYEDFTYSLNSKIITTVSYFELQEYETLAFYLDSFRTYLSRHRSISEKRKKRHLNFISNVRKLLKYQVNQKQNKLLELQRDISQARDTAAKEWLLEKIDQLLYPHASQRDSKDEAFPNSQSQ